MEHATDDAEANILYVVPIDVVSLVSTHPLNVRPVRAYRDLLCYGGNVRTRGLGRLSLPS
jgi:hypothetical protein